MDFCWNSVGACWAFPVDYGCWFALSPSEVRRKSPLDFVVWPKMPRQSSEKYCGEKAKKYVFCLPSVRRSPLGVRPEKQWECKDLTLGFKVWGGFSNRITVSTLITHTPQWTVQAMGFKGLWVPGGGKEIITHEGHGNLRNICIFCYNKSTQLEGKQSMSSGQAIIDAFLFSSVSFMIEQRLICRGGALWADSRAFGD